MTYSQYLTDFFSGLGSVMNWIRTRLFPVTANGRALYNHPLVFTIMGIGLILLIIEELIGLITSLRFGGFLFRHFRPWFLRGYQVQENFPDYTKENRVKPYRPFYKAFYRAKYTGKYFINYNGRYYPVKVPRYNPFAISRFKSEYKAGNIISYSQLFNENYNHSYTGSSIGKAFGKALGKKSYSMFGEVPHTYSEGFNFDNPTSDGEPYHPMVEASLEEQLLYNGFEPDSTSESSGSSDDETSVNDWGITYD